MLMQKLLFSGEQKKNFVQTRDEEIIFPSDNPFWGSQEGSGQNMLGRILMEVRQELKSFQFNQITSPEIILYSLCDCVLILGIFA